MKIICIAGKAQNGKDTTAGFMKETLESKGYRVLIAHFGDLLKYVCRTFFDWNGEKDEKGRTLLQYVGTDKIRAASPDYWANFIVSILDIFRDDWDYVLLPDCRFPNEYEVFKAFDLDAVLLRVVRPDFVSPLTAEQQKHPSETALDNYPCQYLLINNSTLEDLKSTVIRAVNIWFAPSAITPAAEECWSMNARFAGAIFEEDENGAVDDTV